MALALKPIASQATADIALAGDTIVKEQAHRDLIYKPTTLPNGTVVPAVAGWQFTAHKGFMDIKGSVPGFSAYLSRFTDKDELVCVTVLANEQNVDLTELSRRIAAAYDVTLGSGVNPKTQETYASVFDVNETTARLEQNIKAAGGKRAPRRAKDEPFSKCRSATTSASSSAR